MTTNSPEPYFAYNRVKPMSVVSREGGVPMRDAKERLPVVLEAPGATIRCAHWGGMAVVYSQYATGTDFTPVLKGLKDDMCQCPHWGYVLKGALHLRYVDGREDVIRAGDMWYAPPGHTAWCAEDTELVEVSPGDEFEHVVDHVRKQMQS